MIEVGPTGKTVTGDVLDVKKSALERRLKHYDPQLYLHWNPTKRRGYGCWEVRRRPNLKSAVVIGPYQGGTLVDLQYVEIPLIAHVLDVPHLSYQVLDKVTAMDTWTVRNWVDKLENAEKENREKVQADLLKERSYNLKQFKGELKIFRELILSGTNPAELARYWGSIGN